MERLYKSLEQASLSPIGDRRPSTKKELRKSFIKRSKNPCINEKLHKIRVLNSTLKVRFFTWAKFTPEREIVYTVKEITLGFILMLREYDLKWQNIWFSF